MQSLRVAFIAAVLMACVIPAQAADTADWKTIAAKFGCKKKVNEKHAPDDSFYIAQYIPSSESKKNWTRIFTVQLFRAPADSKQSDRYMEGLIGQIPKTIESKQGGDVTVWRSGEGKDGPVAYGEFYVAGEHTVTAVYRVARGVVAVNQFAVRKSRLTTEEKSLLAQLVAADIKPDTSPRTPAIPAYPRPRR